MKLHPELEYVTQIGQSKGIESRLIFHDRETTTCAEKANLLGWPVERVVKALYFHTGDFNDDIIGIITPEIGTIDSAKIISEVLGMDLKRAKRYQTNGYTPSGMSKGTCSPFPRESLIGHEIGELIIVNQPHLDGMLVDISIGDDFEHPKRTSMHITYGGIHTILQEKFGNKIYKTK